MNTKRMLSVLLMILLMAAASYAQIPAGRQNTGGSSVFARSRGFLDALFDPSKFTMTHSYSMSVGSFGRGTYNSGLYLNTMQWKLADLLFMQISVGYHHQPFGKSNFSGQGTNEGKFFLRQAYLEYKPSKNTTVSFEYQSLPAQALYASPFGLRTRRW
ncbi:hypothetical protein KAR48_09690 [bacterium]|nr:hypothetical protein [bacterium]